VAQTFAVIFTVMKVFGVAYLLFLAWRMWFAPTQAGKLVAPACSSRKQVGDRDRGVHRNCRRRKAIQCRRRVSHDIRAVHSPRPHVPAPPWIAARAGRDCPKLWVMR